jgi:4-alpha-glucanotransferase
LIGDIPMFVAHQSADVWAHPELFKLDADGNPSVVAGVPPDYFSKTGQLWGLPVYRWDVLAQQKYSWWIERIRIALRRFDLVRLDHFIGFVRTFEVSALAKTAENGEYVAGGGASFFQALREAFGVLPFIADNLGVVIPEVTALMEQFQIPGTQVLQFEYGSELGTNSILSDEQLVNSVIYTGTHDNDTTEGWYEHLPADQRNNLEKQLGVKNADIVWAMIRKAFGSQANTAIIPMQDFLNLGTEARMNFPGVADGNWQWRLQDGVLNPDLSKKIKNISITNGRLSDGAS